MKIGLLSFEYPPETGFGGIGTYTWYHARALGRLGHEVHVLAGSKEPTSLTEREHDGVHVHRFRPEGALMRTFDKLGKLKCWWTRQRLENAWSMYIGMKELSEVHRFDVLEMPECGAEGLLINSLLPVPTVIRFHSPSRLIMPFYDVRQMDITMCSVLERWAIRKASALTSCSSFLKREVASKLNVRDNIDVIPNGIDLHLFDEGRKDRITSLGFPTDKITILFAGRMERRKGIHLCGRIVQTILREHDVAFVFAGQDLFGYFTETLLPEISAQQLRGSIHYLGKLDLGQLRSCLFAADIFFLPSMWENCPYSCLEAMAARRAIVSTDQGGMPELIEDGVNGLTAKSGDPESFIRQLKRLITDAELRKKLGEAARVTVQQRFTDDHTARSTVEVYRSCLSKGNREHRLPSVTSDPLH